VFTVSRWYSPDNADETGRLLSLAKATLLDMGVPAPQNHLFLASSGHLATLIVGRAPLSRQDVARLRESTARLGFSILVGPDLPAASPALKAIMDAPDATALADLSARFHHDDLNRTHPNASIASPSMEPPAAAASAPAPGAGHSTA
jgi:hypothetical protein